MYFAQSAELAPPARRLEEALKQTLLALIQATEAADPFAAGYTQRVRHYAGEVAARLGLDGPSQERVRRVAEFHSLCLAPPPAAPSARAHGEPPPADASGEILPDAAEQTRSAAKDRPAACSAPEMIELIPELRDCLPALRALAEHYDGSGGPAGLAGEEIPIEARVVAACRAFDRRTTQRPFSATVTFAGAIEELRAAAGRRFDPRVIEALAAAVEQEKRRE